MYITLYATQRPGISPHHGRMDLWGAPVAPQDRSRTLRTLMMLDCTSPSAATAADKEAGMPGCGMKACYSMRSTRREFVAMPNRMSAACIRSRSSQIVSKDGGM